MWEAFVDFIWNDPVAFATESFAPTWDHQAKDAGIWS